MNYSKSSLVAMLALAAGLAGPVLANAAAEPAPDPHAHHHHAMPMGAAAQGEMAMGETTRTVADYMLPEVSLLRDDGKLVSLSDELNDGRAVVLNFIYTTCTAICPVTSKIFSQLQAKLGNGQRKVHLVSISIDPEHDTPPVLREYARKYGAGPEWQHYSGTADASLAVQRAFNVFRGDKMNHSPVAFVRLAPGKPWIRIDGFASASYLARELNEMVAAK